jgi:CubicO group peptidase (beta-lactamase class C family)
MIRFHAGGIARAAAALALGLAALGGGCGTPTHPSKEAYVYSQPPEIGDGWETASAAEVGLDEGRLVRLMDDLRDLGDHRVHSILVVRHGRLVFEEYFEGEKFVLARYTGEMGFDRDDTHSLASVTKSVTTTLAGIALDRGALTSVQQPVFDFFPEHVDLLVADPRRASMTLEHLLTMQVPLVWNDEVVPYSDPTNDLVRMFTVADPIGYALSKELYAAPGALFDYCNASTNILGDVVRRATGQRLDHFADTMLFAPLGITTRKWYLMSEDVVFASGDLELRPRDMAKLGQLFLDRGIWKGQRVISSEWIDQATARIVRPGPEHAWADWYGYGWWHWDLVAGGQVWPAYMASGWGGQWIVVVPSADLVFVSTAGNWEGPEPMNARRMLEGYVLARVR